MEKATISWEDFEKIDLRVGTIIEATPFGKANKPAFILLVDFGSIGIKKTSAQLKKNYTTKDLIGQQIIGVMNFPKKQIANIKSEFLVLGAINDHVNNVILIQPKSNVSNGSIIR